MKGSRPRITVVGSFNMDLVVRTPRRPGKGETVFGTEFGMFCGGKGYNQAVAAARLGADVRMIGRVGTDYFGDLFLQGLLADGVRADGVVRDAVVGTGVGLPVIGADGDNSIVVVPRANMAMTVADVERAAHQIGDADVVLLQCEIPQPVSLRASQIARAAQTLVILNPAPAGPIDDEFYGLVDVLTPNEHETLALTDIMPTDLESAHRAARFLLEKGVRAVLLTLGARGAFLAVAGQGQFVDGFRVSAVDTTGAGDAFCGALAVALAEGQSLTSAARFANAVAALSVTQLGASPSMPKRDRVQEFMTTA